MTNKEFCKIESSFSGEKIDSIHQLQKATFNGQELKEYIEYAIHYLEIKRRSITVKKLCFNEFGVNYFKGTIRNRVTILFFKRALIITF